MTTTQTFTAAQIKNFKAYVRVQRSGRYNMFDPRAARDASLSSEEVVFVMVNYQALEAAVTAADVVATSPQLPTTFHIMNADLDQLGYRPHAMQRGAWIRVTKEVKACPWRPNKAAVIPVGDYTIVSRKHFVSGSQEIKPKG